MKDSNEDELRRSVRKYVSRRQRAVLRGQASPSFPRDRSLVFHIVPETFDPYVGEGEFRSFGPSNLVPNSSSKDWTRRFTRDGYRFDWPLAERRAFATLLRSGAVEFGVVPAGDHGVSWDTLQWTFKESLYELAQYVWSVKSPPKLAFISLLVVGASPDGIIGLPEGFVAGQANSFEEKTLRLGPLLLKAEDVGTRQFQPMFNLLFQCAGLRHARDLLHL
ncbi:MAG TPA: hypothetical protein VFP26_10560 [Gemmatimonadaceae bacterium]|nr:hypothetical protein [Gemmatimonadaceae bacterium]